MNECLQISMDNCACDTGFQFYGYNSHIYSIHQQETEIHLETHAYQSLHYYYGNSGFSHSGLQFRHSFDSHGCNSHIYSILTATTIIHSILQQAQREIEQITLNFQPVAIQIPETRLAMRI